MRLHTALTALVTSSPIFSAGIVNASESTVHVSPVQDSGSTATTLTTTTTKAAGQTRDAGIQPGAPSHHRRRAAAEQMRRRRDRILQRKEATAEAAAAAAEAANDGDASAKQERQRRVAKARASAIVDAALAAGDKDGDAILGMIDGRVVTEVDVDVGERTPAAKGSTKDGALGAEEVSLRLGSTRGNAAPVPAGGSDRTAAVTGAGATHGTAGSNLSSNVKAGRTQSAAASSVRRAVHVPADPTNEVRPAEASSSDGHDDGILSSIADDIASGTIAADGMHGLTDAEAAEAARALTSEVETDAGMLASVARGKNKHKGKDEAALRAAGLTSPNGSTGPGPASSSTGDIRRAKAAAASGAALRRSISPAAQAAADTTTSAAEQLVELPLQEGDEGKYIEEDDGRSDVGLFVGSTAAGGHRAISANARTERHLGVAATSTADVPSATPSGTPSTIPSGMPSGIPSEMPSGIPSEMPSSAPSCPADGTWVDCLEGYLRSDGTTTCDDACGDDCCVGYNACVSTTACIKKDGSCDEKHACQYAGYESTYKLQISGPSCTGVSSCFKLFHQNTNSVAVVNVMNSCLCKESCYDAYDFYDSCYYNDDPDCYTDPPGYHCEGDSPAPLDGLPTCGMSFNDVVGRTGYDGCRDPSSAPSNIPSKMPSASASACPTDGTWVDCFEGYLRSDGTTTCDDACGDDCCVGDEACDETTACIKKDGSCDGDFACQYAGYESTYQLQISGPSCTGEDACYKLFHNNMNGNAVISLTDSCLCNESCYDGNVETYHCEGDSPEPLPGLPACGQSFNNVAGIGSSACAPSNMPSDAPSVLASETTSNAPSDAPSATPSETPSNTPSSMFCPPLGEDAADWVDCLNGYVRGTDTSCDDICGLDCCVGTDACYETTACIKKDGSCDGNFACQSTGYESTYQLQISGPSCTGQKACYKLFHNNTNGNAVISLTDSCLCKESCYIALDESCYYETYDPDCTVVNKEFHCEGDSPAPLDGLPTCGMSFNDVVGRTGYDGCRDPSSAPSNIPSKMPSASASACPPDGTWVDCLEGYLRSDGTTTCDDACGDDCCVGDEACDETTACIKKDGSCDGNFACQYAGYESTYKLQISGPSCTGEDACYKLFHNNMNGNAVISLTDSCLCNESCYDGNVETYHCEGDSPEPLPGLPACGQSFNNVAGIGSSACAPSTAPSSVPSSELTTSTRNPTTSPVPSTSPSEMPSSFFCPPLGEDPDDWVNCFEGYLRSDESVSCAMACDGNCCVGDDACYETTACIKKDGSCDGITACQYAGYKSTYQLQISGPSCFGEDACSNLFYENTNGNVVVSLTDSCLCTESCYRGGDTTSHCKGDSPAPLPGLPACGESFDNVAFRSDCGGGCGSCFDAPFGAPSVIPSEVPSVSPSHNPSDIPSTMRSDSPSWGPSSHPSMSAAPSAMPSSSPSKRPTKRPSPAPRPPPTRSPTKLPSSSPSVVPSATTSAMPSNTTSDTPSAPPSSSPSITASSPPSASPSNTVSLMPSTAPTISQSPSAMSSSRPSTPPSSGPSNTPSSVPSSQPSAMPSSSPTPECQDFDNFDQTLFSFQDFGLNSVAIAFQGTLALGDFEDATCDALKDQQETLGVNIVSCCASAEFIPNGRRLQDSNTTNVPTTVVEFTTAIAYTVNTAVTDDVWQIAFADAINSDMFGDMIGGTVEDLQQLSSSASGKSMKSSKSAVVSGGSKSSKSASSTGGSNMSSKSMKSASSSF